MKKFAIAFLLACLAAPLYAQDWTSEFSKYGDLFVVKLDSAQFPHPARAQGHKYHNEFYSAETHYSDNSVGIFVPKGFRPTANIDFVVHFHGWRHHIETTVKEYHLVEQFVEAGRNAILIIPQGPLDAPDSFGGKLEDPDGFKHLMTDIMATLQKRGVINHAQIGSIILSGHSGGYHVISPIFTQGGLSNHIREVWLFDANYDQERFQPWFKQFANGRFIDIYTLHGGTKEETENLMKWLKAQNPPVPFISKNEPDITANDLRNNHAIFMYSALAHDQVMFTRHQFAEYLKTSHLAPIKLVTSPKAAD